MDRDALLAQTMSLRAMSVEQKLLIAQSLRAFAWEITKAAITRRHPELSETDVLVRVRAAFSHDGA